MALCQVETEAQCAAALGLEFRDTELLSLALTSRSAHPVNNNHDCLGHNYIGHRSADAVNNNETLEFVGDKVLRRTCLLKL